MAELSERALDWIEGIQDENEQLKSENGRLNADRVELEEEVVRLRRLQKRTDDLLAAMSSALTNLGSPDSMSGVAVSNQKAAARVLNDAIIKYNARGPMDP